MSQPLTPAFKALANYRMAITNARVQAREVGRIDLVQLADRYLLKLNGLAGMCLPGDEAWLATELGPNRDGLALDNVIRSAREAWDAVRKVAA